MQNQGTQMQNQGTQIQNQAMRIQNLSEAQNQQHTEIRDIQRQQMQHGEQIAELQHHHSAATVSNDMGNVLHVIKMSDAI